MTDSPIGITVPEEPPEKSVIMDAEGYAWQRFGAGWFRVGRGSLLDSGSGWANVLLACGPVHVIHEPALKPAHT